MSGWKRSGIGEAQWGGIGLGMSDSKTETWRKIRGKRNIKKARKNRLMIKLEIFSVEYF